MRALTIIILMTSAIIVGVIHKKQEAPKKSRKAEPIKSSYIYKKSENKKTNYLEKEDSLNLIRS